LTFTVFYMGCQKVPKLDFQNHFSMSKISRIRLNLFFKEVNEIRRAPSIFNALYLVNDA
jgi:hypothetical protein